MGFTTEIGRKAALAEQQTGLERGKWCHDYTATLTVTKFLFSHTSDPKVPLPLLLQGTPFQIKVWEALLEIPSGAVISYAELATRIGSPSAARSVGTACGANRLGLVIPCHRVIRKNGVIDSYRWGKTRKLAMLAYEAANVNVT